MFGMQSPKVRPTMDTGKGKLIIEKAKMADFKTISDSVKDLIMWFEYNNFPDNLRSLNEYVAELKNDGYFTDSLENYKKGLERWMNYT